MSTHAIPECYNWLWMKGNSPDGGCDNLCVDYATGTWGMEFNKDCIACYQNGFAFYPEHNACGPINMDNVRAISYFSTKLENCGGADNMQWAPGEDPFVQELTIKYGESLGKDTEEEIVFDWENQNTTQQDTMDGSRVGQMIEQITGNKHPRGDDLEDDHMTVNTNTEGTSNHGSCKCKEKKDPCKQYTPEEKAAYYKNKCQMRMKCKEAGACPKTYRRKYKKYKRAYKSYKSTYKQSCSSGAKRRRTSYY